MRKHLLTLLSGMLLSAFVRVSPAYAFGWPTFDLGEVFNTIQSTISQVQTQIATTMETYSIANIQQAIGDKLGGLQKIKDVKAKLEKAKEKAEQVKKRAEKVLELKKKYEEAAKNAINQVQDAYSTAQGYVNDVKNQVENVKGQVEGTINNVKGQVENVKNQIENVKGQVEGTINNVKGQVENVKNQIENVKGQVENTINDVNNRVNDLFGSPEDNFDFENNSADTGSTGLSQTNSGAGFNQTSSNTNFNQTSYNTGAQTGNVAGVVSSGSFDEDMWGGVHEQTLGGASEPATENGFLSKTSRTVEDVADIEWGDGTKVEDEEVVVEVKKEIKLKSEENLPKLEISGEPAEEIKLIEVKTDGINKKGDVINSKKDLINSKINLINERDISVSPKDADKLELKEVPDIKGRTEVKAFKKVSFYQDFKTSHAAQTAGMKTGTDDEGNFYFPDAFAQWVGINFDETPDEQKLWDGIEKICADLKSSENYQTQEFDRRFDYDIVGQMRANAQAHSIVGANESESGKTVDDLSNMIDAAGGTTMTQISGMGEISAAQIRQNRQEIVRLSDDVLSRVFDEIRSYCFYWPETEEEVVPASGFKTGTDNEGNFYFPQRMAEWCSLNFDDDITEQVMEECFEKIASEYYAAEDDVARQARTRFRKMKMEAVINAFINAHNAKKRFANDKEEDAVEQINTDDADSERTMTSGNAEINKKLMEQMGQIDLLRFSLAELDNLNTIENDGEIFVRKGKREQ